ncbi:virulence factor Mce family protein [Aeromicrobium marinum DSM 15272]|uniref:Virulence factor Mce family protein n=1 Tax=Aeromicrobium marinum DSM 15272 TaxID=585531 RepID=E2SCQ7_9ACTN|nr:MCE family protein [Aeromicrobium marinum]EFQ83010.1 virulence factor Mce family protein [Aeromicrobium marinum DSM 15272]
MKKLMTNPRLMGLIGISAVAALGLAVLLLSVASFGQRTVTAVVEHTAGLRVGEEVQVAGVGVGEVTGIELTDTAVAVTFTIDADIPLGADTTAAVKVATLLGTHFLEVAPSGSGELPDDTIALARTSVPFNLQDVIEGVEGALTDLDETRLAEAMTVVAEVLEQTPEETRAAVAGVAELSAVAADRTDQLTRLLEASNSVTGQLNANRDDILALLDQSVLVLAELNLRKDTIDALLRDSLAMATQVTGLLAESEADLDPLMEGLTFALGELRANQDQITDAVQGLSLMAKYVANASGNGPWIDLHVPFVVPDDLTCLATPGVCS